MGPWGTLCYNSCVVLNHDHIMIIWVCLKMLCTPLYPMVLLIIIPMKNGYFIGNIPNIFRQTHIMIVRLSRNGIVMDYGYGSVHGLRFFLNGHFLTRKTYTSYYVYIYIYIFIIQFIYTYYDYYVYIHI